MPLQISQLGFQIILCQTTLKFKFRSLCACNEVSSKELQNEEVVSQIYIKIYIFGVEEGFLKHYSISAHFLKVPSCFLASVSISISAFTHHSKTVICHFQILHMKTNSFSWRSLSKQSAAFINVSL